MEDISSVKFLYASDYEIMINVKVKVKVVSVLELESVLLLQSCRALQLALVTL